MRAAFIDRPQSIVFTDAAPEPDISSPDQVKIRTAVTGICGSEVHAFHGTHPFRIPPVVSGHEAAGEVVEVGANVTRFKPGDRVLVEPHYGCGGCELCQSGRYNICPKKRVLGSGGWSGSFGEYFVAPEGCVIGLPPSLSFEEGALIEVLAVGMHAVGISGVKAEDRALVIGAGPIGLGTLIALKLWGITEVIMTDALEYNVEMARKMECPHVFNVGGEGVRERILELTGGRGVDCTFLAFGSEVTLCDAFYLTKRGGTVVEIAIMGRKVEVDFGPLQMRELTLMGSNMYTMADFDRVIEAIKDKRIDVAPMISKVMPVERCSEAMEIVDKRTENIVKVMLKF